MPLIYQPIQEITTHILDPITEQLVFRIIKRCNLTHVFEENVFIKPGYASISETSDFENKTLLNRNLFKCDVTYQMNPLSTKWPFASQEHLTHYGISSLIEDRRYPIFYDPIAEIKLYEIGNPKSMQLNCTMTFLNRETAYSTIEAITSIYGNGDEIYHTNCMFDFPIHTSILGPLFYLYKLQNYEQSFKEYMEHYADPQYGQFGVLENRDHTNTELVIRRNNIYTMYQLEFQDEKPTEDNQNQSTERYNINFQVATQFNCPSKLFLYYPVIINNQDLPKELVPKGISSPYRGTDGKTTQPAIENIRQTEHSFVNINNSMREPKRFPFYDDWELPNTCILRKFQYQPFFISTFTIEPTDITTLDISDVLDEEEQICLRSEVIKILKFQKHISFQYDSLINISIFMNDKILDKSYLTLTEEGNIQTQLTNTRKIHHVILSLAPSSLILSPELDWRSLFNDPSLLDFLLSITFKDPTSVYSPGSEFDSADQIDPNDGRFQDPNDPNNPLGPNYVNDQYDPDNPLRPYRDIDQNKPNNIHDVTSYVPTYGDLIYGSDQTFRIFNTGSFYLNIIPTRKQTR
jgi:hypothetical protein